MLTEQARNNLRGEIDSMKEELEHFRNENNSLRERAEKSG